MFRSRRQRRRRTFFSDMAKIGERISWLTVHGIRSGVVEKETDLGWFVRMDNGMAVIVHETSVRRADLINTSQ